MINNLPNKFRYSFWWIVLFPLYIMKISTQRLWRNNNMFFSFLMYNGGMPSHSILVRRHKNTRHIKKKKQNKCLTLSFTHTHLPSQAFTILFFCTDQDNFMSAFKKYRQHKHYRPQTEKFRRQQMLVQTFRICPQSWPNTVFLIKIWNFAPKVFCFLFFCLKSSPQQFHEFGAVTLPQFSSSPMCTSHTFKSLLKPKLIINTGNTWHFTGGFQHYLLLPNGNDWSVNMIRLPMRNLDVCLPPTVIALSIWHLLLNKNHLCWMSGVKKKKERKRHCHLLF